MENTNSAVIIILLVLVGTLMAVIRSKTLKKQLMESQKGTLAAIENAKNEMAELTSKGKEHHDIAKQTMVELQEIKRFLVEIKREVESKSK